MAAKKLIIILAILTALSALFTPFSASAAEVETIPPTEAQSHSVVNAPTGESVISATEPATEAPLSPTEAETQPAAEAPITIKYPEITKIENVNGGVKITWDTYEKNTIYRIYYMKAKKDTGAWDQKYSSSGWKRIAEVKGNTFTHKNMTNGELGIYTVRCVNAKGQFTSDFNREGWENRYYSVPVITSLKNAPDGVKISWSRAKAAELYAVYRKEGSNWKRLTATEKSEYTDTSATSGKNITYTLRMLSADGKRFMSYFNSGKSISYVAAPRIKSVVNTRTGAKLTWDKTAGASYYRVTYWNGKSWTQLTATASTSYTDTSVTDTQKREYTITCLNSSKTAVSDYHRDGYINIYYKPPVINTLTSAANGVKITWTRSKGAEDYRIYRKESSGWKRLAQVSGSEYFDASAVTGVKNTYTIRMVKANSETFMSDYLDGKSINYSAMPSIKTITNTQNGVKLTWDKVSGATYYRIYYKSGKEWSRIAQVSGTSYTDTSIKDGETRTYTIRCLNKTPAFVSDYNKTGFINTFAKTPVIKSMNFSDGNYTLIWDKPAGIYGYRIYRKGVNDVDWIRIADKYTGSEFIDITDQSDRPCAYTLRAQDVTGNLISGFISNPFYLNGKIIDDAVIVDGYTYRFIEGVPFNGFYRENDTLYYYQNGKRIDQDWYKMTHYSGAYSRAQWLFELMKHSGNTPDVDANNESAVFELAKERGIIGEYTDSDIIAATDRRFVAHTVVNALKYPRRTIGTINDTADPDMLTLAYFGYFLPDSNNNLNPENTLLESEFDDIISELILYQHLKGKTVIAFGDSIINGQGNIENNKEGIPQIIGLKYGMSYKNYSVPGASMGKAGNKSHIPDQIRQAISAGQRADLIIFNGGTNDAWQQDISLGTINNGFDMSAVEETDFTNSFEKAVWLIKNHWKNIPVIYVRSHKMKLGTEKQQQDFGNRAMALAEKWRIAGIDLYNAKCDGGSIIDDPQRYSFDDDTRNRGIHPNALGYAKYYLSPLGECIARAFGG